VLAMLEKFSVSDKAMVDAAPNPMAFRNNRAVRILRGMAKTFISGIIYGNNGTNSSTFNGLAVPYGCPRQQRRGRGRDRCGPHLCLRGSVG